jgi:hypothetical protein
MNPYQLILLSSLLFRIRAIAIQPMDASRSRGAGWHSQINEGASK